MRQPEAPRGRFAVAAGLASVLVVVLVSAAIRLNGAGIGEMFSPSGLSVLRAVHRTAASLETLAALWVAWMAWGRGESSWRATAVVLALTVFLAALGIVAGKNPAPVQALGNVLGGLALAAAFAWILGEASAGTGLDRIPGKWAWSLFVLLALQALIGARLSIFSRAELPALPLHALLGLGVAALLGWLALARMGGGFGRLLFMLALVAPLAGFTALQYEYSATAALVHAASAAFLVIVAASAFSRNA